MANPIDNTYLSSIERQYLDYKQKGDDFMKIEIYRSAKEWYIKALELNQNQEMIRSKLDNCNMQIQLEKKKITIVVLVIAIVLFALVLL